jgi:hypothetical protein
MAWLLVLTGWLSWNPLYGQLCNNPITGKDAVVDKIGGELACVFCNNADLNKVTDGDLSNFVTLTNLASVAGAASLITIKDIRQDYPAGRRTGFVIESVGGLLSANVLSNLQIRTYLNNTLQETATFGGGGLLNISLFGEAGVKRRLDFVTTQSFDEVELVLTGGISALTTLRIYYAYEEPATGCDYNCITEIIPANGYTPSIVGTRTGISGICVGCNLNNTGQAIDNPLNNFATINFGALSVGATGSLSVNVGTTVAAGNEVGFAIEEDGLLGLLNASVLGNIRVRTYLSGTLRDDFLANNTLVNVGVLSGGINVISFEAGLSFDEVRISITNVSAGLDYYIYYSYIRPDADNDGFPDCVDKCAGNNDNLDADGDGTPDACDASTCIVNAGLDITICPPATTAQLTAAGVGQTWSALPGNPSAATINSSGMVSGLSSEGIYQFVLTQGACQDTVAIQYLESAIDYACNDPIAGYGTVVTTGGLVNGVCVLCNDPQINNVRDGDLSNFVEYSALLSLLSNTTLVAMKDTVQTYPAGTRAGFVVSVGGGLLNAAVLGGFQIRTYLNGTLQETATTTGNVLGAGVAAGTGNKYRISFVTAQSFDEVELLYRNTAGVLTSIRVYYAFEENAASCPNSGNELSCTEILSASSTYCAMIDYDRSGFTGAACSVCKFDNLGHLVDDNAANFTTLTLTAGVLTNASMTVKTRQTIPAGYETGFAISGGAQLLDASVLGGLRLTTYLNGTQQESILATSPLVSATLLGNGSDIGLLRFRTTLPFDALQLTVQSPVSANVLSNLSIYYAFVRRDTDADGTPDCYDKCCGSNDDLDSDGNGVPDACDAIPDAVDDAAMATTAVPTNISVLANDNFGADGAGSVSLAFPAANGTAVVNDNGTPTNPSDDYIIYTSNTGFTGTDIFRYRICDTNGSCDDATVTVTVTNAPNAPVVKNDINNTLLNTPTSGNVLTNDSDPNNSTLTVNTTPVAPPTNGTVILNTDGTYTYTPNNGFLGTDQFTYLVCNAQNFCDQAVVTINVFNNSAGNNPPVAHNDIAETLQNVAVNGNVLNNDVDPDNNPLTVNTTPVVAPANGTVTLNANGTFTYTPNTGFTGMDQFTYQVCDPSNACDQAIVTIIVNADPNGVANNPPNAQDDAFLTFSNTPVNGNVSNNDSDPNGDALTVFTTPVVAPANGTLTLNSNGTFTYTPNTGFTGNDQFVYQICDPSSACDQATVYLNMTDQATPDLTPVIAVTPTTGLQGAKPMRVIVDVKEINNSATNGQIIVTIAKVSFLTFTWSPTATIIGGVSVDNAYWTFAENGSLWVFRSNPNIPLAALSIKKFGFVGTFDAGAQSGNLPFTVNIINGTGGDTVSNNNNDDDTIIFQSQQQ